MHRLYSAVRIAFHRPESRSYRIVEAVIWTLILFSIILFAVELALGRDHPSVRQLIVVDRVVLALFAIEISLRILTFRPPVVDFYRRSQLGLLRSHIVGRLLFCLRPLNLIDLLTVVALVPALRGLRALRLLRLVRTTKVFRYGSPFSGILRSFRDNRLLFTFGLSLVFTCVLVGGVSLYLVEASVNSAIDSVDDGIWWALVTITTVGFGDIHPVSPLGRLVGGSLMVSGLFSIALFAGIVGQTMVRAVLTMREEHVRMSTFINHIVICGYDPGARMLLDAILVEFETHQRELVIFAEGERPGDIPDSFLWVSGDPTKESELDKVRMAHASAVIVVGSRNVLPQQADATSILTVFTIRSYMKRKKVVEKRIRPLYIVTEILDAENVDHAVSAGANEVIETTKLGFSLLAHAIRMPGTAAITSRVAAFGAHSVYLGQLPDDIESPIHFGELAREVRMKYEALLIGIREPDTGRDQLNPSDSFLVTQDIELIYLAERAVLPRT